MATKRISELPAKGATIGATDLVEISEPNGLGGYVSKRVTGAQLGTDTNLSNTDLVQTLADAVRTYDINGNVINFTNGQVAIGTPLGTNYALEVNDSTFAGGGYFTAQGLCLRGVSSTGLGGQFEGVSGVAAYSTSGNAILGQSISGGLGGKFEGGAYVETYGFGGSAQASAVFESASTTKGALLPRMTTAQRDAIAAPATGLEIYNTTTNRKEFYNGTYWRGDTVDIQLQANQSSPTASTTTYFGYLAAQPTATAQNRRMFIRKDGVIRFAEIYSRANTAGDNTNWSLYVRLNDTTDYLIQTVGVSANERIWTNSSLNIPVVAGDYIEIKMVNPAWVTAPANITFAGRITIE